METTKITDLALPEGWWIERKEDTDYDPPGPTRFEIFEPDGPTWKDGTPRESLTVELYPARQRFGQLYGPEVSWPGTSDKRPELALALAVALTMAAEEARA